MDRGCCPAAPAEISDAYRTGRLSRREAAAFEEHYLACPRCSEPFQFTEKYLRAVRRAAERFEAAALSNASR